MTGLPHRRAIMIVRIGSLNRLEQVRRPIFDSNKSGRENGGARYGFFWSEIKPEQTGTRGPSVLRLNIEPGTVQPRVEDGVN
jgi:hypothetical protein